MFRASLNHVYRLVWSRVQGCWIAVAETGSRRRKAGGRAALVAAIVLSGGASAIALAGDLPTGGNVVAGTGSINTAGTTMTVIQSSARMVTDWQSFNVGAGRTVNFVQPDASAVALNRVLGADVSVIQGAINANGQVFLINPNGVLFTNTAQVNVGGLVASTLPIATSDFMAGRLTFQGASDASVVNQGQIRAQGANGQGGTIALLAARIINDGSLTAHGGNVLLGAGSKVTLDLGGPVKLSVDNDALETLITNGGAIRADGGTIWLTSQAASELTSSVINQTGVIEAQSLATGETGSIVLFAHDGQINVGGRIDAPGGFVETSGKHFAMADAARITAGQWLIDPVDITIDGVLAASISTALDSGNVTISTSAANTPSTSANESGTAGDIKVDSAIYKTSGSTSTLTLAADRNILVNADISGAAGHALNLVLAARAGGGAAGHVGISRSTIRTYGGDVTIGGGNTAASDYAIVAGTNQYGQKAGVGVFSGSLIDASSDGAGTATTASNSTGGGNIVLRGKGDSNTYQSNWGVWLQNGALSTGGSGNITVTGYGGQGQVFWSVGSIGVLLESNANLVAKSGNIVIAGYKGSGGDAYGIASTESNKSIKTEGYLSLEGDTLLIRNGTLTVDVGQDSDIKAPIVGTTGSGGGAFTFQKSGAGVLNLWGNAQAWNASRPANTSSSSTNGTFSDTSNRVNVVGGVTSDQALYAFSSRPTTVTTVAQSTATSGGGGATPTTVYLRLIGGSSVYGEVPTFSYAIYDQASGGSQVSDGSPTGSVSWSGAPTATSAVGSYSISYGSGIALGNTLYSLEAGSAVSWSVTARPVTVTANALTQVYGNAVPTLTYQVQAQATGVGLRAGDTLSGALATAATSTSPVGTYAIVNQLSNANYRITYTGANLTVTPRPITVSAASVSKSYGDADPALAWQVTGGSLVGNDGLSGVLVRESGESVGTYTIDAGRLANANYAVTSRNGLLTIRPPVPAATTAQATMQAQAPSRADGALASSGSVQFVTVGEAEASSPTAIDAALTSQLSAAMSQAVPLRILVVSGGIRTPE